MVARGRREQGAGNATQGCQDQGCPPSLQQLVFLVTGRFEHLSCYRRYICLLQ
ncbi:hypothetical protein LEMLEM_LOCUS1054 [Lemmus lemmus]